MAEKLECQSISHTTHAQGRMPEEGEHGHLASVWTRPVANCYINVRRPGNAITCSTKRAQIYGLGIGSSMASIHRNHRSKPVIRTPLTHKGCEVPSLALHASLSEQPTHPKTKPRTSSSTTTTMGPPYPTCTRCTFPHRAIRRNREKTMQQKRMRSKHTSSSTSLFRPQNTFQQLVVGQQMGRPAI